MGKHAVFFDLRGTLRPQANSYGVFGAAEHYEDAARVVIHGAHKLLKTARQLKRKVIKPQIIPDSVKRAVWGKVSHMRPEALGTVAQLRASGIATAVLSNDPIMLGQRTIKYGGLDGMFDAVSFADNSQEMKPDPRNLLKIVADLDVGDGTVFMVGDKASDMLAAFNADALLSSLQHGKTTPAKVVPIAVTPDTEAARYLNQLGRPDTYVLEGGLSQLPDVIFEHIGKVA